MPNIWLVSHKMIWSVETERTNTMSFPTQGCSDLIKAQFALMTSNRWRITKNKHRNFYRKKTPDYSECFELMFLDWLPFKNWTYVDSTQRSHNSIRPDTSLLLVNCAKAAEMTLVLDCMNWLCTESRLCTVKYQNIIQQDVIRWKWW